MPKDEYGFGHDSLWQRFSRWFSGKPAFETTDDSGNGLSIKQWVANRGRGLVDTTDVVIGQNVSCRLFLKALKLIDRQLTKHDDSNVEKNLWRLIDPLFELRTIEAAVFMKEHYAPLLAKILEKYVVAVREGRIVPSEPESEEESPLDISLMYLLVRCESPPGLRLVARLIREGHLASDLGWRGVCDMTKPHTAKAGLYLMLLLGDYIPGNILGMAYLEMCNQTMRHRDFMSEKLSLIEETEKLEFPYNSPAGRAKLAEYINETATDIPEDYCFHAANEAINAIAYVEEERRLPLAHLAMQSENVDIVLAGAIYGAQLNDGPSLEKLAEMAADLNYAASAVECLQEQKRTDLIPKIAEEPSFIIRSRMVRLIYEDGCRRPDEIDVVDHREMVWPPLKKRTQVFALRFVYHAEEGGREEAIDYGIVHYGELTALPVETLKREPSIWEIYAMHCAYEMEHRDWQNPETGLTMLKRYNPDIKF